MPPETYIQPSPCYDFRRKQSTHAQRIIKKCKDHQQRVRFDIFHFFFYNLELAFVAAGDNDVVDLEHHAAKLGGEQELLALRDERVDDEGGLHVCGELLVHASTLGVQDIARDAHHLNRSACSPHQVCQHPRPCPAWP
jgi:hypothetical protein